jgi:mannan endo-1,4-beta-mannosidase
MTVCSPCPRARPTVADARRRPGAALRGARVAATLLAIALTGACATLETMNVASEVEARPLVERAAFGAFTYGGVWRGMEPVVLLEAELGRQLDVVHWFMNWDHVYDPRMAAAVAAAGRAPLISWQPMRQGVREIAAGAYDDVLRDWARGVRAASPNLVYLRPFPEMNGEWVPWNGDPEGLRAAWIRMTEVFAAEGADNVRWVWSPNVTDQPRTEENRMERYYPGDAHVDVLGLSGYNWGETRPYIGWRSFETVFATGYERVTALGPQPLWLTELASSDEGGDKPAWVRDMFASTAFPRIAALIWFDEHKEADWRLRSAPEVIEAFRASLGVAPSEAAAR